MIYIPVNCVLFGKQSQTVQDVLTRTASATIAVKNVRLGLWPQNASLVSDVKKSVPLKDLVAMGSHEFMLIAR